MTDVITTTGAQWTPVSRRLRAMRHVAVLWLLNVTLLAWSGATELLAPLGPWRTQVAVVLLVGGVVAWWGAGRTAASWAYAEREEDLHVRRGTLVRQVVVVPYGRVQLVEVTAGPLQQAFGLATVRLVTASPGSRGRVVGVTTREAARLRDRLTELGQARASGL